MKKSRLIFLAFLFFCEHHSVYGEEKCVAEPKSEYFNRTTPSVLSKPKSDEDECDFYQRAWQMFLYAVSPDPLKKDHIRLQTFPTPADVFGKDASPNTPQKEPGMLSLAVRMLKSKNQEEMSHEMSLFSIDDPNDPGAGLTKQADQQILIDQNGHALHYGVHMNDTFVKFIRDNGYTDLDKFSAPATDLSFTSGSIEFKSSWRTIDANENKEEVAKTFFVTEANIPSLEKGDKGQPIFNPNKPVKKALALVGLHVVGVIDGHPEFIWATFEHKQNAPSLNVNKNWEFNSWPVRECNRSADSGGLTLDGEKKITPITTVCRENDFRTDPDIASLNEDIHDKLNDFPEMGVWKNYDLMGAVWLNNPDKNFKAGQAIPNSNQDDKNKILIGEVPLANATMETFQQSLGCFDCHQPFPSRINVSHIPLAFNNMKKRNLQLQLLSQELLKKSVSKSQTK